VIKKLLQMFSGNNSDTQSGKRSGPSADPVTYKDLTILPAPLSQGGQYKTAGSITQLDNDVTKTTSFVRADSHTNIDDAVTHSIAKAKQIIDERGNSLFDNEHC